MRSRCAATKSPSAVRAVLLAAGLGTRLRPLTNHVPKCLVSIAGRPLLDYWLDPLAGLKVRQILVNTHHLAEKVGAYIERVNARGHFRITESYEPQLLGSAGTIHANRDFARAGEDCLIIYADNLSDVDLGAMMRFHWSHDDPITMLLFHSSEPEQCGIAEIDEEGRITDFVEKPGRPTSDLANAGVYAVTAEAYCEIADMNVSDFGFDVLPAFVGRMHGWIWNGYHRDIGTLESLREARKDAPRVLSHSVGVAT